MEIFNFRKSAKIFFLAFTILFICAFVSFLCDLISEGFDILTFILLIIFAIPSIILPIISLVVFSSKTILQENGIIYKTVFKNKFHSWDDINFAAEYELTFRYTSVNGIICSIDLKKDEIKFRYFADGYTCNKHYICIPYSEETKDFLIDNLSYGKYLGLVFTDESFDKK